MSPRHGRLSLLFSASLALHALVLALVPSTSNHVESSPEDGPLTVVLAERRPAADAAQRSYPPTASAPVARAAPRSNPAIRTEPKGPIPETPAPTPPGPASAGVEQVPSDDTGNSAASTSALGERIARLAAEELTRYFTYPRLARQHGWSGTVLLAFTVESDGRLEHIRVARSSGYALLDRSAASDLARVRRLWDAIPWLRGEAVALTLPVEYRLLEK